METKENKNSAIQALRGLAFLLIFLHHSGLINIAGLGVSLFFIMSGFLLARKYSGKENENKLGKPFIFFLKHIKKLYILHLITLVIAIPFSIYALLIVSGQKLDFTFFGSLLANITLTHSLIPIKRYYMSFNGVSWFLSSIAILYLLFPAIVKLLNKITFKKWGILTFAFFVLLLKIAVDCCLNWFCPLDSDFALWITCVFPLSRIPEFLAGILLGIYFKKFGKHFGNILYILFLVIGTGLAVFSSLLCSRVILDIPLNYIESTSVWIVPALLIFIGFINNDVLKNISTENVILVKLGDISAYAFLIHQLILRYISSLLDIIKFNNVIVLVVFGLLLTIVCSITYQIVDNKIRQKIMSKKTI